MDAIFFYIGLIMLFLLILGLIKPSKAIFWNTRKTRSRVLLFYGLGFIFCSIMAALSADSEASGKAKDIKLTDETPQKTKYFTGMIRYEAEAEGTDKEGVKLFKDFAASAIEVYFTDNHYRLTEEGGINEGSTILDLDKKVSYFLDSKEKTAIKTKYWNIDDSDEKVKELLPTHYVPILSPLNESEQALGYTTQKFLVEKSGFVKENATAYIWVCKDINLPPSRYEFNTNFKRILAPLPISIGEVNGTILKMEVNEGEVRVIYTAVKISTALPADNLFQIPGNYTIVNEE